MKYLLIPLALLLILLPLLSQAEEEGTKPGKPRSCIRCYTQKSKLQPPPKDPPKEGAGKGLLDAETTTQPPAPAPDVADPNAPGRRRRAPTSQELKWWKDGDTWVNPDNPNRDPSRPLLHCEQWEKDGKQKLSAAESNFTANCTTPCGAQYTKLVIVSTYSTFIQEFGVKGCTSPGTVEVDKCNMDLSDIARDHYLRNHTAVFPEQLVWFEAAACWCTKDYCNSDLNSAEEAVKAKWDAAKGQFPGGVRGNGKAGMRVVVVAVMTLMTFGWI